MLSDRLGNVTLLFTNWLGQPLLPWDVIVSVPRICEFTEAYTPPDSVWLANVVEVFESLFAPVPAANPTELDFGAVPLGESAELTFVLDNAGTGLLELTDIVSTSPLFAADPTEGEVFAVGDSLLITVTFEAETGGQHDDTLTVATVPPYPLQIPMTAYVPDAVSSDPALIQEFSLACFPNPFNAELTVQISSPRAQTVSIRVYDVTGKQQASLFSGQLNSGPNEFKWSDAQAPSGIYLLEVKGDQWSEIKKIALVR